MSGTVVIRNQLGHYWGAGGILVTGSRAGQVSCCAHRGEAINTLFELGSKDTELWGEVFEAETDGASPRNLEISEHPVAKTEDPTERADTLETHRDTPT